MENVKKNTVVETVETIVNKIDNETTREKLEVAKQEINDAVLTGVETAAYGVGVAAGTVAKPASEFGVSFKRGFLAGFYKAYNK